MNLQPVTGTPFWVVCVTCKKSTVMGDGCGGYADLDGKAFEAYYCNACAGPQVGRQAVEQSLEEREILNREAAWTFGHPNTDEHRAGCPECVRYIDSHLRDRP